MTRRRPVATRTDTLLPYTTLSLAVFTGVPCFSTTAAARVSPHSTEGTPTTATSSTTSCERSTCSTSPGEIFSPPRTMTSSMRSEEHTSELQSLMHISYAVFCLKKKPNNGESNNEQGRVHTSYKHNKDNHVRRLQLDKKKTAPARMASHN